MSTLVERKAFEDAVRKLLQTPPISKEEVSRRIRVIRYRPLKPAPKTRKTVRDLTQGEAP